MGCNNSKPHYGANNNDNPVPAPTISNPEPSGCGTQAKVFLSYRKTESGPRGRGGDSSIFKIKDALSKAGFDVFLDEGALPPGHFESMLVSGIEESSVFVPVCTATYGNPEHSEFTHKEFLLAHNIKKRIIPIWHSAEFPPPALASYLATTQRVPSGDVSLGSLDGQGFSEAMKELINTIRSTPFRPESAPEPDPAPAPLPVQEPEPAPAPLLVPEPEPKPAPPSLSQPKE